MPETNDLTRAEIVVLFDVIGQIIESIKAMLGQLSGVEKILGQYQPDEMLQNLNDLIECGDSRAWTELCTEFNYFVEDCRPLQQEFFVLNSKSKEDELGGELKSFA